METSSDIYNYIKTKLIKLEKVIKQQKDLYSEIKMANRNLKFSTEEFKETELRNEMIEEIELEKDIEKKIEMIVELRESMTKRINENKRPLELKKITLEETSI